MSCPSCHNADLDSSGICPACGFDESAGASQAVSVQLEEKESGSFSGLIELDYSSPSNTAPLVKQDLPQWRQDLAKRLQEIRQKRETIPAAGELGSGQHSSQYRTPQSRDAVVIKEQLPKSSAANRAGRRIPCEVKLLPSTEARPDSKETATRPAPASPTPLDLPLFQPAASDTKTSAVPNGDDLKRLSSTGTGSGTQDIQSLIDSVVARQPGKAAEGAHQEQAAVRLPPPSVPREGRLILVSRTLAGMVDLLVVVMATGAFIITADAVSGIDILDSKSLTIYSLLLIAVFLLYSAFFLGTANQTIGMMLTDLKIINSEEKRPRLGQILWRCFGFLVSVLMFGVGLLWGCFDRQSRCLHDRISDTHVVRV